MTDEYLFKAEVERLQDAMGMLTNATFVDVDLADEDWEEALAEMMYAVGEIEDRANDLRNAIQRLIREVC